MHVFSIIVWIESNIESKIVSNFSNHVWKKKIMPIDIVSPLEQSCLQVTTSSLYYT